MQSIPPSHLPLTNNLHHGLFWNLKELTIYNIFIMLALAKKISQLSYQCINARRIATTYYDKVRMERNWNDLIGAGLFTLKSRTA